MYIDKKTNKIILEIYNGADIISAKLKAMGYTYTTETKMGSNSFWCTVFSIEKPKGKGSVVKIDQLFTAF